MFRKMLLSNKYSLKLLVWWLNLKDSLLLGLKQFQNWLFLNCYIPGPILKFLLKLNNKFHKPKQQSKVFTILVDSETWEILDKED